MIVLDCKQGSDEWIKRRLGIPTASQLGRIITPKTGKLSTQSVKYAMELCVEHFLRVPADAAKSGFMDRGKDMEGEALAWYSLVRDVPVERVGMILRDDGLVGGSPDGLVGDDGIVEVKCLSAVNHIDCWISESDGIDEYNSQQQGNMYLSGRKWCDRIWYHPTFPSRIVRVERDDEFIAGLHSAIEIFLDTVLFPIRRKLEGFGFMRTEEIEQAIEEVA